MLFAVTKEGVYRHEIVGVFTSARSAIEAARLVIKAEPDHYHAFAVVQVGQNRAAEEVTIGAWRRFRDKPEPAWYGQAEIPLDPQHELTDFALAVLAGDLIALDAAQDILALNRMAR